VIISDYVKAFNTVIIVILKKGFLYIENIVLYQHGKKQRKVVSHSKAIPLKDLNYYSLLGALYFEFSFRAMARRCQYDDANIVMAPAIEEKIELRECMIVAMLL